MQFVVVKWRDAEAAVEWRRVEEIEVSAPEVYSFGWLVADTKKEVILAADLSPNGKGLETNRRVEVPRGMILEVTPLELMTQKGKKNYVKSLEAKVPKKPPKKKKKAGY